MYVSAITGCMYIDGLRPYNLVQVQFTKEMAKRMRKMLKRCYKSEEDVAKRYFECNHRPSDRLYVTRDEDTVKVVIQANGITVPVYLTDEDAKQLRKSIKEAMGAMTE
ncbi:hypothetical protein [Bacillus thuringiensis]|uniref:hypothetical protein n=1 Tax=Bacillus thuringiensis TaxID=1428 RepID=UPI0011212905|nr:hypothetical protein [Bacillus thuringiensis]MED3275368.1 hypothetical protein [Bacillus thuringiensis]